MRVVVWVVADLCATVRFIRRALWEVEALVVMLALSAVTAVRVGVRCSAIGERDPREMARRHNEEVGLVLLKRVEAEFKSESSAAPTRAKFWCTLGAIALVRSGWSLERVQAKVAPLERPSE